MDVVDVLQLDHRKIEKMFSDFQSAAISRSEALEGIRMELLAHTQAEQEVFYPAVRQWASDEVDHAMEEHQQVEDLLLDMSAMDIDQEEFSTKFAELMKTVQGHIGKEEAPGGLMEVARKRLSDEQLSRLADEIDAVKTRWDEAA